MSSYAGVSLFYADDGKEWAKYLRTKLSSREYAIHSELNNINEDPSKHIRSTIVNTFLVSPDFLDLPDWDIMKEFNPNTSLAILTGTDFTDLKKGSSKKNCKEVLDWLVHELTRSEDEQQRNKSVREMLMTIVAAYEGALRDDRPGTGSPSMLRRTTSSIDHGSRTKHSSGYKDVHGNNGSMGSPYDFLPPQRQVNDVHACVMQDGKLFVILHRAAEGTLQLQFDDEEEGDVPVVDKSNPAYVYVFPLPQKDQGKAFSITLDGRDVGHSKDKLIKSDDSHTVVHTDTLSEPMRRVSETEKLPLPSKHRSKYVKDACVQTENDVSVTGDTFERISSPVLREFSKRVQQSTDTKQELTSEAVDQNRTASEQIHKHHSSKLDQIYELLKDEMDPEELLCRCLGIERDVNKLDNKLASMIEGFQTLRHISHPDQKERLEGSTDSTWPTLLHFGAEFDLHNFCEALLNNPMMHGACLTRNKDNQLPHDVARRHGHTKLSILLKHYSKYVSTADSEGRHDSGFSGGTPRLSTITVHSDTLPEGLPPRSHYSRDGSRGYTPMNSVFFEDTVENPEDYENRAEETEDEVQAINRTSPKLAKPTRTISDDVGFGEEEFEPELETTVGETRISGSPTDDSNDGSANIFGNLLEYSPETQETKHVIRKSVGRRISKDSITSSGSKSSFYLDDDGGDLSSSRKDSYSVNEPQGSSPSEKKGLFGFLKKKKSRSASEPSISPLQSKSKAKVYKRESNRSSSTSTSSSSSATLQEPQTNEDIQVQYRDKDADAQKSKTKFRLFMSKAQRRKSIRMKNVLEDKNMSGPTLPIRRRQSEEMF